MRPEMMVFFGCRGISWTTCKQSAFHSIQITTPTPHHSVVTGQMLFLLTNKLVGCGDVTTDPLFPGQRS